jgi:hypothetical protein
MPTKEIRSGWWEKEIIVVVVESDCTTQLQIKQCIYCIHNLTNLFNKGHC